MLVCVVCRLFFKFSYFKKKYFTIKVSNGSGPDLERRAVGPDPGPNFKGYQ